MSHIQTYQPLTLLTIIVSLCVASTIKNVPENQPSPEIVKLMISRLQSHFATLSRQSNNNSPFTCGNSSRGSRVRKEIRDLTPRELRRWKNVIRSLMTQRPNNPEFNPPPSFWDLLVAVHIVFRPEAHSGSYFLPWHRFFLLFLENHIRENFFTDFTLPYWDWSAFSDAANPALSSIWSAQYIGGSNNRFGLSTGTSIPNGPFQGTRTHYLDSHPVRRGFVAGRSGSMRAVINSTVVQNLVRRRGQTFGEFSDALETAHNIIHTDIGGDMFLTATAPNDPVFYLHHAYVDKIWADRQRRFGVSDFGGDHTFITPTTESTEFVSPDFVFQYYDLPVRTSFNQDCVAYQPYSSRASSGGVLVAPPNMRLNVTDVCRRHEMMTEDRCLHGEEIIAKAAGTA